MMFKSSLYQEKWLFDLRSTYQAAEGAIIRRGKKILGGPDLDNLSIAENGNTVRDLYGRPTMGNKEGRSILRW
jgi:hypothetical protein